MKNSVFYIMLLMILACKKKEEIQGYKATVENNPYEVIINFLEKESLRNTNKATVSYIERLKLKIEKSSIQLVNYYDSKVIVVSLSKQEALGENQTQSNRIASYHNFFNRLVFYLNQDTIINAEILEFHTDQGEQALQNDMSGIINFNPLQYQGEIRYRQLNHKFIYSVLYDSGKKGYAVVKKKNEINNNNAFNSVTNDCIDWYLITTYTYPDGSQTVTEEFVGRTCSDPNGCSPDPYLDQLPSGECSGGGGSPGGSGGDSFEDVPRKKLCGNYNWKITGSPNGASNTVIKNLFATYSPNNNPGVRITVTFSDACVTIPNYCSTNQTTLSAMLNDAFNNAVSVVEARLSNNTIPGADWAIKAALDAAFKAALILECPGSHFANQGCTPDIPWQFPTFCG